MHQTRRRSVPTAPQASASSPRLPLTNDPQVAPQPSRGGHGLNLESRAQALAKMTLELNLRSVSMLAQRLEKEVQQLVAVTNNDSQFRQRHEKRVNDLWREIVAVKASVAEHGIESAAARETPRALEELRALELRCEKEAAALRCDVTAEISQLRAIFDTMAVKLDELSSTVSASLVQMSAKASGAAQKAPGNGEASGASQQGPDGWSRPRSRCANKDPKMRIREAINSTRRWHRDHKTTKLQDGPFVANYLRQQSKRDPVLAVMIQKAIQRRIQDRHGPYTAFRPRSLDDFCRHVEWHDVLETVKQDLVKDEMKTIAALSREDK